MQLKMIGMVLLLVAGTTGCAGNRPGASQAAEVFTQEVGPAVPPAVEREALPILERFGYTILRTDRMQDRISIETNWEVRPANEEEQASGVRQTRSRIVITTRPRGTTNGSGMHISGVTVRFELQHIATGGSDWVAANKPSAETAAMIRRIADALRLELQVKGMQG